MENNETLQMLEEIHSRLCTILFKASNNIEVVNDLKNLTVNVYDKKEYYKNKNVEARIDQTKASTKNQ